MRSRLWTRIWGLNSVPGSGPGSVTQYTREKVYLHISSAVYVSWLFLVVVIKFVSYLDISEVAYPHLFHPNFEIITSVNIWLKNTNVFLKTKKVMFWKNIEKTIIFCCFLMFSWRGFYFKFFHTISMFKRYYRWQGPQSDTRHARNLRFKLLQGGS